MNRLLRRIGNLTMPGTIKKFFWKLCGFKLGKGLAVSWNVVLACDAVDIGDYVELSSGFKALGPKRLTVGDFTTVSEKCFVNGNALFEIGKNCFLGYESVINCSEHVKIGSNTALAGARVQIWTHSTWMEEIEGYNVKNESGPVEIGENCYIGTGAIILPGVSVNDGGVVGARALVTKDVPANTMVIGVPAKPKKRVTKTQKRREDVIKILKEFLKRQGIRGFSFYPDTSGKVVFSWGEDVKAAGSLFDLKNKTCRIKNTEGVEIRKKLNWYIARF